GRGVWGERVRGGGEDLGAGGGEGGGLREVLLGRNGDVDGDGGGGGIAVGVGRRIGEAVDEGAAGRQRLEQGAGGRVVDVAAVALQRQRRAGAERDWSAGGATPRTDLYRMPSSACKVNGAA